MSEEWGIVEFKFVAVKKKSVPRDKSYQFSIRIVRLYQFLCGERIVGI